MKTDTKSCREKFVLKDDAPKIKTLDIRVNVTHGDLNREVKEAFALAKSNGQELNLMFTHAPV